MSRIKAAIRVLVIRYWSQKNVNISVRPIVQHSTGDVIGYFDRISVKSGEVRLDGWVNADNLCVLTESESVVLRPDLDRSDVIGAGPTPGFSVTLRGCRTLKYSAGPDQPFTALKIGGAIVAMKTLLACLLYLTVFALRQHRDIWAYFAKGDLLAGDRLEIALQARPNTQACPTASTGLFGHRPLPVVKAPVDIIVPVYNAFHEVKRCLECLERHTDALHQIILIDDASTDPRVRPVLERFAHHRRNVRLIVNSENKGFVESVNAALAQARGHVVLLNSDAFVGPRWLDRLMAPMLTNPGVASVTPLSNEAEILSLNVPQGVDCTAPIPAADIDAALERLDWHAASCEVPTGIGFCMLMNREWLDRAPLFDTTFGKGYGEEVDWCLTVTRMGAIHIGHGGLFVEHKGASSFMSKSAPTKAKNQQIISNRFPGFDLMVQDFRHADPLIGSRLVASLTLIDNGEPVPVYLAHNSGGGAELWLSEKIGSHAIDRKACIVVRGHPNAEMLGFELYHDGNCDVAQIVREDLSEYLTILGSIHLIYSCLALTNKPLELVKTCLQALRPTDLVDVLFHDYFPICPSHNLIGSNNKFCGLPSEGQCQKCYAKVAADPASWPARIDEWRTDWMQLMDRANRIVAFSNATCDHILQIWPHLWPKILVEPHQMTWLPPTLTPPLSERTVVGVLGSIGFQKGAEILQDLAAASDGAYDIVTIGQCDPRFASAGIKIHGDYSREEIGYLAERYKISCWVVPSIWPETFCYAAHEVLATGLPVLGFDLGAQGEAIHEAPNGIILSDSCKVDVLHAAIMNLHPSPAIASEMLAYRPNLRRFGTQSS